MSGPGGLTERTVVGLGWTSLVKGAQAVLQIAALIVLARIFSPEQFGLYFAAIATIGFSMVFTTIGIGAAIVQRSDLEIKHVRTGFTVAVLASLAVTGAVFFLADKIAEMFEMPELAGIVRLMSIGLPLQGVSVVAEGLALRSFRFRWLACNEAFAFAAGYLVVAPILALFNLSIFALAGAYLSQQALRAVVLLIGQPHSKFPILPARETRELLIFGSGFTLAKVGNYVATQADNLVVGKWLGAAALGLYAHAYQLMASPATLFGQMLDRVLFPTMASVQRKPDSLARAYYGGVFVCSTVMLPIGTTIAILSQDIVHVLLGPKWAEVAVSLRILSLGLLFRTGYKISDSLVRAKGAVFARAWRQAIFAVSVFTFAFVGKEWGLEGVAWGVVLALGLVYLLMAQLSLKITEMTWLEFGKAHVSGLVLAFICGTLCLVITTWLRELGSDSVGVLGAASLASVLVCIVSIWTCPRFFIGTGGAKILTAFGNVAPHRVKKGVLILLRRVPR